MATLKEALSTRGLQRQIRVLGRDFKVDGVVRRALSAPGPGYRRFRFETDFALNVGSVIEFCDTGVRYKVSRLPRTIFAGGAFSYLEAEAELEKRA